ncbi:5259_t:CDS:1, partial [Ambispora leptoticha]
WTSGNHHLDEYIKETQAENDECWGGAYLEWIPYDEFKNISQIGKGGFGTVYSADWTNGRLVARYSPDNTRREIKVALKRLHNSADNVDSDFIRE